MTASVLRLRSTPRPAPRRTLRADPLAATLLVAVALGVVALWIALAATRPAAGAPAAGGVAIVVDAGGRPAATLGAARAAGHGRSAVAIRVPRTAVEAATDVRYFAAQRYGIVVAVGPAARAAARSVAREFPRTRFVLRSRLP